MPIVTEREYRGHCICICPAVYPEGAEGHAVVSVYAPNEAERRAGNAEWLRLPRWRRWADLPLLEGEGHGTEDALFRWAEREVDGRLGEDACEDCGRPCAEADGHCRECQEARAAQWRLRCGE